MSVYDVASAEDVAAIRDRVAALEATVARQDAALRRLVAWGIGSPAPWNIQASAEILSALDAPATDPAPDAGGKTPEQAKSEAWALLASHGFNCCDNAEGSGLIAWRRDGSAPTAQQQPALPANVREAMREAAWRLQGARDDSGEVCHCSECRASDLVLAARLRELAGEP